MKGKHHHHHHQHSASAGHAATATPASATGNVHFELCDPFYRSGARTGRCSKMTNKHEFNVYASTKTTAQLFLDLAACTSHGMTLFIILNLERRDVMWSILFYSLIVTIAFQAVLAVGLFTLRLLSLKNGSSKIPRVYKVLNDIFFWGCLLVAALEVGVAAIEKFGLGHSYVDHPAGNGSFTSAERTTQSLEEDLFK